MAIFRYRRTVDMPPKEGQKFATTYYRQSPEEYQRTREHIIQVSTEILEFVDTNSEYNEFIHMPLRGFPRTRGLPNYSLVQILTDILDQTIQAKDLPSGMLGRWSRLFANTEYDIEMLQEFDTTAVSPRLFEDLFQR